VLVIADDAEDGDALLGDIILTALRDQRAGGVVCRGRVRDVGAAETIGVPLWASGVTPRSCVVGNAMPRMPREINLNGVTVRPGDWLFGDADGLVRVAQEHARNVIKGAALKGRRERVCLARMAAGERLLDMMNVPNALNGTGAVRVPF
jgi:regulator of RNase E activity RraA